MGRSVLLLHELPDGGRHYDWLIERDEVGRLTMFFYLIPVLGLGMAALAFREEVGILEGMGALLTVAGLGPTARESWRHLEPSPLRHRGCGAERR